MAGALLRSSGFEPYSVFDSRQSYEPGHGSYQQIAKAAGVVAALPGGEVTSGVVYELGVGQVRRDAASLGETSPVTRDYSDATERRAAEVLNLVGARVVA
jgi:hypothetical protein